MSYKNLEIWQLSRELVIDIHAMSLGLPKFEQFEEAQQIRRSIKSVKSNIVEGYGRRMYKQEYIRFIIFSFASQIETIDHLETLYETNSLTDSALYESLHHRLTRLGIKLNNFLQALQKSHTSPSSYTQTKVEEDAAPYDLKSQPYAQDDPAPRNLKSTKSIKSFPMRIGLGYDVHQLEKGRDFWLGGIKIPHTHGAKGHSDADVVCHVICDALLGAANMRNIGYHFSDKDPQWKGVDSKLLLSKVMEMIREAGYEVGNVDVTVVLQEPKLNPHIPAMKECLAEVMQIDTEDISIKATTSEHIGFVGRKEGIAAHCVALIYKQM